MRKTDNNLLFDMCRRWMTSLFDIAVMEMYIVDKQVFIPFSRYLIEYS